MPDHRTTSTIEARRWLLRGRVQGVGFRPFVYRMAHRFGLTGWVRNGVGQVEVFAEGDAAALTAFGAALIAEAPPLARPEILLSAAATPQSLSDFSIRTSDQQSVPRIHVPPDYFACDDCLSEVTDPHDRRYRYPFINCTQCGPRYTLIERLPYDRANTTMAAFRLCADCAREYADVLDRRFHAEPIACPVCGPQLQFYSEDAGLIDDTPAALAACTAAIQGGAVVAVKGIGGYHLLCDARDDRAIARLRLLKPRPDKPLAVLFPLGGGDGLDAVRAEAALDNAASAALRDPARPIVLVPKRADGRLSPLIAPGLAEVGAMLPYSPLHHLLVAAVGSPLVATSANISGEPVLTSNVEAERRLASVADAFLHHDRPIARPADDPVYRVIARKARPLRLGRGAAPLELPLPRAVAAPTLAVGGHLKNTVALAWDDRIVVSPHISDLGTPRSLAVFEQVIVDLQRLYQVTAERVVCDAHPDYASTRFAHASGLPVSDVLHHHAHASAVAGEFPAVTRWLIFTWDGVGLGADGTLWGGEALLGAPGDWRRVASFRPFRLPGGDKAGREPWRSAMALCWEAGCDWAPAGIDTSLLRAAWERRVNTPQSSAVGRLFDAAAALTGLHLQSSFEGQGPMVLEAAAVRGIDLLDLPLARDDAGVWRCDWSPLLPMLQDERRPPGERAGCFHSSIAQALVAQVQAVRAEHAFDAVGLSGGVFQNRLLAETAVDLLARAGVAACLSERVPCNDGGLSYGQLIDVAARDAAR